jgi:hypothetical protein
MVKATVHFYDEADIAPNTAMFEATELSLHRLYRLVCGFPTFDSCKCFYLLIFRIPTYWFLKFKRQA